jgi:DNA mismatch endonuclease (patch repair protein)
MADVFTKQKRSEVMAAIHGRGNRSTEWRLRARLVSSGISGWRMNAGDVMGKPDFVFSRNKIAVFVDGCFWHGCRKCRNIPASNQDFWSAKIEANKKRDHKVSRNLRKSGWQVIRFWEHELKRKPAKCVETIKSALQT